MCFEPPQITVNAWCTHCHQYHVGLGISHEGAGLDLQRKQEVCRRKAQRMARAVANSNRNAARWRDAFETTHTK